MNQTLHIELDAEQIAVTPTGIWTKDGNTVTFYPTCGGMHTGTATTTEKAVLKARGAFRAHVLGLANNP